MSKAQIFYARQPIYDADLALQGYELLFRNSDQNAVSGKIDDEAATSQVLINAFTQSNLASVCSDKPAFVNFSAEMLDKSQLFPPEQLVVEVLETVELTSEVVETVKQVKQQGYRVAIDDYDGDGTNHPLLPFCDIVKLEYPAYNPETLQQVIENIKQAHPTVKILAEKLETQQDFDLCKKLGCDYFQGYFLARPELVRGQEIPVDRLSIMQLLAELNNPIAEMDEITRLVGQDPLLSVRILKLVNSAMYNLQVSSLKTAIMALGLRRIRTYTSMIALTKLPEKPLELHRIAATRASVCQALCDLSTLDSEKGFTVGLFSCLESFFGVYLDEILESVRLEEDISQALVGQNGVLGLLLHSVIEHERSNFDAIRWEELGRLNIGRSELLAAFEQGIDIANQNLRLLSQYQKVA